MEKKPTLIDIIRVHFCEKMIMGAFEAFIQAHTRKYNWCILRHFILLCIVELCHYYLVCALSVYAFLGVFIFEGATHCAAWET